MVGAAFYRHDGVHDFFGFVGVGVIGLAVGELAQSFERMAAERKKKLMKKMADALASGHAAAVPQASALQKVNEWTKKNGMTRLIRIFIPVVCIGACGAGILLATEDADSAITVTSRRFLGWGAACSSSTSLSVWSSC